MIHDRIIQPTSPIKSHQNPTTQVPDVNQHQKFSGNNVCNCFSDLKCFKSSCSVSSSYFDRACGVLEQVVLTVKVLLQVWATHIDGNGCKNASCLLRPPPHRDRLDFLWSLHTHQSQECISLPPEPAGNSAFLFVYNVKAFHKWPRLWRKLCILTFRQLTKLVTTKQGLNSFWMDRKSNVGRGAGRGGGRGQGSEAVKADAAKVNWKRKWGLNVLC